MILYNYSHLLGVFQFTWIVHVFTHTQVSILGKLEWFLHIKVQFAIAITLLNSHWLNMFMPQKKTTYHLIIQVNSAKLLLQLYNFSYMFYSGNTTCSTACDSYRPTIYYKVDKPNPLALENVSGFTYFN